MTEAKQKPEDVEDRAAVMLALSAGYLLWHYGLGAPGLPEFTQDDYEANSALTAASNYEFCSNYWYTTDYC